MVVAVHAARTGILLAELAAEAPDIAYQPSPAQRLARRPLADLVADLERARSAEATRAVAERRATTALEQVTAAESTLCASRAPAAEPRRGPVRRAAVPAPSPAADPDAERRLGQARAVAEAAEAALAELAPAIDSAAILEEAVVLRERQLQADVLRQPPPWLRADVAHRVAMYPPGHDALEPGALAQAYGGVATYAERAGLPAGPDRLDDILDRPPPSDDLTRYRDSVLQDLDLDLGAGVATGVDLSL